jgi:protocatechuate 3,4-dioxygenase beta subunit
MTRLLLLAALAVATSATIVGGSARANGTACPAANAPNELVLVGGSGQTGQLGKQFAQNLQVALANSNGCPLTGNFAGITVNFDAPGSGASGIFAGSASREAHVTTDAQGIATAPQFTANYTAGSYTVDAHSDYGTVELVLANTAAGLPAGISAGTGTPQQATVNSRYAQPLQVRVTDASGNPVQGAAVGFSIVPGSTGAGASFLGGPANSITDSNGLATSLPLLANGTPGSFEVVASADGLSGVATFSLDNHAAAATLTAGERAEAATVHTRYGRPLSVRVVDASGQPVEGAAITFSLGSAAGDGGASRPDASFAGGSNQTTVLTDQNGQAASPPFTAGDTPGEFTATASAAGATNPVSYRLRNLPARLSTSSRTRRAAVGHRLRSPLAARVTDMHGQPIGGATVTFTIGKSSAGATASFADGTVQATVTSGAGGRVVAPALAANTIAGTFAVTAAMPGGTSIRYTLTNDARTPASIAVGAASGQSLPVRSQLPLRLAVTVTDAEGNAVEGAVVSFAAPTSGPGGSFTAHHLRVVRVETNRRGVALAPPFRANAQAGGYAVTVRAGGVRAGFALVNRTP